MDPGTSQSKTRSQENDGSAQIPPSKLLATGITPLQQMISSCSGALITSVLVTPLDVIKVRVQSAKQTPKMGTCFLCSNGLMDQLHVCMYDGTNAKAHLSGDAFIKIARTEGISSLWSGLPPTLAMAIPATVCYFTLYDNLYLSFCATSTFDAAPSLAALTAGSLARLSVLTVVSPLEMARTKMQSEQMTYRAFLQSLSESSSRIGWRNTLFKGWVPTALRDVPFSAVYWMAYEQLKAHFAGSPVFSSVGTLGKSLCAGGLAGALAATVTLPFDVCKTRRQVEIGRHMIDPKGHTVASSTFACVRNIYKVEGFSALFKGLSPRLIRVAPACAIMIGSYEYGKEYFRRRNASLYPDP